ncbi:MAG: hypothetical protein NXI17_22205 [Alphaproteobacteria bacterium]|nr:hypothetical protein [Alphaproteobacteria bacterium]
MIFKKALLSAAVLPWLSTLSSAHPDAQAHGVVAAQTPHIHFGAGHAIALGTVGIFVAILIAAVMLTGSFKNPLRKRK